MGAADILERLERATRACALDSFYVVGAAILLGGVWGTGKALPIAGAGHVAARWEEQITLLPLALGSFASFLVVVLLLIQWRWKA